MRKHYLVLAFFVLVVGALNAAPIKDSLNFLKHGNELGGCDPPIINADSLLLEYFTNQPLSAVGGVPPYTYTFSPPITSSELISPPDSAITYTITVTGANGCDSIYHAHYVPIPPISTGACAAIFVSEYIQDTVNHDNGIELYNPTNGSISLSNYYLFGTTNGSLLSTPFYIALHGTIAAHKTFLIANTLADTSLTHKANMLSDSLNFGGKDIVTLAKAVISAPNVSFEFLDEIGTIYPLPTDSGWAVGSGSTKNHTLVRQSSVIQGSTNWSTCKTEWTVYPRGTFSYIHHYTNACTPTDPDVTFAMQYLGRDCGTPSYTSFAITAQSNPPTIFNNCIIDISFYGGMFAGDSVSNGGVIVTRGPSFQPDTGNDYNIFDSADISPGVAKIILGNTADSSVSGTEITTVPDTLFIINLRIQNSCQTGAIRLTNYLNTDTAYFGIVAKVFDSLQATYRGDSLYTYVCDSNCCGGYDDSGNCIAWCDSICLDSVPVFTYDSIFTVTGYSNEHYTGIIYSDDSISPPACPMQINPLSTTTVAGSNAYSLPNNLWLLTITGNGFGATRGSIQVSDANSLGTCELDTGDILSWSENKIYVKMPSYIVNNPGATPGTGPMTVYNACGENVTDNLHILYNIEDWFHAYNHEKLRSVIVMHDSNASLLFHCDSSVYNNPKAFACVKKAVKEWNCFTGVNWRVGADTTLDITRGDDASVIYFDYSNSIFPDTSVLMVTRLFQPYHNPCFDSVTGMDYYNEADIGIRLQRYLPSNTYWSYDTLYSSATRDSFYFYDYMLHELGHAMGLGHINDSLSLMYFDEPNGVRDSIPSCGYYPGPATIFAANDMMNTTGNPSLCSDHILVPITRECYDHTEGVPEIPAEPFNLTLYPNPAIYGNITIDYVLKENSDVQFKIMDCTGRVIMNLNKENRQQGTYEEQININNFAQSMYFFVAIINGQQQTIKFVKL